MAPRGSLRLPALLLLPLLAAALGPARGRRPPAPSPIEKVAAQESLSLPQFAGKWFLVGVASRCRHLAEHSHQLEATALLVALEGQSVAVSTFRKLDGMCWEIRQRYLPTKTHGRFLLKGRGYSSKVDVVVGETDYNTFAILYYQKGRSISVKLYGGRRAGARGIMARVSCGVMSSTGRASRVSDAVAEKFEQHVRAVGLDEDVTYYFPTYGFCNSADEFHILDETKL